jgi:hypothetical protein
VEEPRSLAARATAPVPGASGLVEPLGHNGRMGSRGRHGVVSLGNDVVIEWVNAFCESLHRNSPGVPLIMIPFDERIAETRRVVESYGYEMLDGPGPAQIDEIFTPWFSGNSFKAHYMRKFCAWETFDTFLFADADVVFLRDLSSYFDAYAESDAEFVHFATDMERVYLPGELRERMVAEHNASGFNSGVFMSSRGVFTAERLREITEIAAPDRAQLSDLLDQGLMNYAVDVSDLRVADANELVPDVAVAGALMRIVPSGDGYVLSDKRVPQSGRGVSILHWAGYKPQPTMAYRRLFLRYRLPGASPVQRALFDLRGVGKMARKTTPQTLWLRLSWVPYRLRSWLSARGLARWPY